LKRALFLLLPAFLSLKLFYVSSPLSRPLGAYNQLVKPAGFCVPTFPRRNSTDLNCECDIIARDRCDNGFEKPFILSWFKARFCLESLGFLFRGPRAYPFPFQIPSLVSLPERSAPLWRIFFLLLTHIFVDRELFFSIQKLFSHFGLPPEVSML